MGRPNGRPIVIAPSISSGIGKQAVTYPLSPAVPYFTVSVSLFSFPSCV